WSGSNSAYRSTTPWPDGVASVVCAYRLLQRKRRVFTPILCRQAEIAVRVRNRAGGRLNGQGRFARHGPSRFTRDAAALPGSTVRLVAVTNTTPFCHTLQQAS